MRLPLLMPDDGIPAADLPRVMRYQRRIMKPCKGSGPKSHHHAAALARGERLLRETGLEPSDWIGATLSYHSAGTRKGEYARVGTWSGYQWFEDGWRLMDMDKWPMSAGWPGRVLLKVREEVKSRTREEWTAEIPSVLGFEET